MNTKRYLVTFFWTFAIAGSAIVQAGAADAAARLRALKVLQARLTAPSLVRLLKLNGDQTANIEKLGHPTNSADIKDVSEIHSTGNTYIAVVARRYPPEVKHPFGRYGLGICFLFDKRGNLKARFGGKLGPDGLNGDDVQLKTLGTKDRWFVEVSRFEKHPPFTLRRDIYLIEDENKFPLAFRIWGFPNAWGWTVKSQAKKSAGFAHFFNPGGLPSGTRGMAGDGKKHELIIGWDPAKDVFRGPSQIKHKGKPVYQVDLRVSQRFLPVKKSDAKQSK